MRDPEYSSVDPKNGNITYSGPLEIMKGNHDNMPARSDAYLPGDERGHINASSLGGTNDPSNIVAQNRDLNHGAYLSVENSERAALKNGAAVYSEKTAIVDSRPGDRPNTFMVNDCVTYADGHTEHIHHSFTNESYALQSEWNDASAALPGTFDAPDPGDGLRASMSSAEYADMMEATDAGLPEISADYEPADFSGASIDDVNGNSIEADDAAAVSDTSSGTFSDTSSDSGAAFSDSDSASCCMDSGADCSTDCGVDADPR